MVCGIDTTLVDSCLLPVYITVLFPFSAESISYALPIPFIFVGLCELNFVNL